MFVNVVVVVVFVVVVFVVVVVVAAVRCEIFSHLRSEVLFFELCSLLRSNLLLLCFISIHLSVTVFLFLYVCVVSNRWIVFSVRRLLSLFVLFIFHIPSGKTI